MRAAAVHWRFFMMVMMMMMTEQRRDGCISKIFLTVLQREKRKVLFSGCAGVICPR